MLRTSLHICSTAHLPADERDAIDRLIVDAPRNAGGRLVVQHPNLVIEPYQFGFFVHTGLAEDDPEHPDSVSPELWAILRAAATAGASWVLFDCDEPPDAGPAGVLTASRPSLAIIAPGPVASYSQSGPKSPGTTQ